MRIRVPIRIFVVELPICRGLIVGSMEMLGLSLLLWFFVHYFVVLGDVVCVFYVGLGFGLVWQFC